jgi:hypothetical protein
MYSQGFTVEYIDRNKNAEANEFTKAAARNTPLPVDVFLHTISDASIKTIEMEPKVINIIQDGDWRAPIMAYLCIITSLMAQLNKRECNKELSHIR